MNAGTPLTQHGGESSRFTASIRENFNRILEGTADVLSAEGSRNGRRDPYHEESSSDLSMHGVSQQRSVPVVRWQGTESDTTPYSISLKADTHRLGAPNFMRIFPAGFSLCCFAMFLVPISTAFHLSQDRNVRYWLGNWGDITILLPILFIVAFFIHVKLRQASWAVIYSCLFIPAVVLLIFGDVVGSVASDKAGQLFSVDCDAFDGKRNLENSWKEAFSLYSDCLEQTQQSILLNQGMNLTMDELAAKFRFQDCIEYAENAPQHQRHWDYLWSLEEEHRCSGWCVLHRPLWTHKKVQDSCSVAVSQVFYKKVRYSSKQIMTYTITILVVVSLLVFPDWGINLDNFTW